MKSRNGTQAPGVITWILLAVVLLGCGDSREATPAGEPRSVVVATTLVPGASTDDPTSTPSPTEAGTAGGGPLEPLAATVNGQPILLEDYELQIAAYAEALAAEGLDPESDEGRTELAQIRRDVLESMIDFAIIEQEGERLGVQLSDEEVQAQIAEDIAGGGGQAEFDEWLLATSQTLDDYTVAVRQSLFAQKVMDAVSAEMPAEAEQVHVRQIVLDTASEAEEVLALLGNGSDFGTLAQERSLDLVTAEDAGDLGWLPMGVLVPELEAVAFSLEPGDVSAPIALEEDYYVLQVLEREESRPLEPEMEAQLRFSLFEQWLQNERDTARIERLVGE